MIYKDQDIDALQAAADSTPMTGETALRILSAYAGKLAAKQTKPERLQAIRWALDAVIYVRRLAQYGDCNTCGDSSVCPYRPKLGDQVRINCPFYQGPRKLAHIFSQEDEA